MKPNIIEEVPSHEEYANIVGMDLTKTVNIQKRLIECEPQSNQMIQDRNNIPQDVSSIHFIPKESKRDDKEDDDKEIEEQNCNLHLTKAMVPPLRSSCSEFGHIYRRMSYNRTMNKSCFKGSFTSPSHHDQTCSFIPTTSTSSIMGMTQGAKSSFTSFYHNDYQKNNNLTKKVRVRPRLTISLLMQHSHQKQEEKMILSNSNNNKMKKNEKQNKTKDDYKQQREMKRIHLMLRSELSDEMISYLI